MWLIGENVVRLSVELHAGTLNSFPHNNGMPTEMIQGVVDRVTFHNTETGYCVLKVKAKGHRDPVPVVGKLPQILAGEFVEALGQWIVDKNFGAQFKADSLRTTPPHTAEGIVKYLSSGLVKGIGPKYAKKIVETFGEKTLDIIDKSVNYLEQVPGIGPKRIALIREGWVESRAIREIVVFLNSYGIGPNRATRIYRTYGENAIEMVRENPYRLSTDIWGIGFKTADEMAMKMGIDKHSSTRAEAAVRFVLQDASFDGHVCLPEELVVEQTSAMTDIPPEIICEAIVSLIEKKELIRDVDIGSMQYLYLKSLHKAEESTANRIKALLAGQHSMPNIEIDKAMGWAEQQMGITLAPLQRKAVVEACQQKVLVITGGPGTGKTTLVRAILDIFAAKKQRILLAAPTGRAAKRLTESTGKEAKTIHRLLEFDAASGGFKYQADHKLDADLFVIDETSMVDIRLAKDLLEAIPDYASVIFVGDIDQLPSVGPGSLLNDLITSGVVPVVKLSQVHRQAAESWIIRAAHSINSGHEPESAPPNSGDFYVVENEEPGQVVDKILQMVKERIPNRFGFDPFNDVQVLCPMNKTEIGVQNLNEKLQQALNPPGPNETARGSTHYRVGDKVLQTQNNYKREVFNGDIGRIVDVHAVDQIVTVDFEGKRVDYDFKDLDELQLAYAITIHKSQGSEYPVVIIPIHTQNFVMLQRNLLYTGVTRGRKLVVLVGSRKAIWIAVNKADTARRFGQLAERLKRSSS
jgi:exodeoxyribonuclease V alpha subunit